MPEDNEIRIKRGVIMRSNESAEDYLESILILSEKLPVVRSVDISNDLGYKKSSISIAMKNLRAKNLITMTDAGYIYLTEEGMKIAKTIYERHKFFTEMLIDLGVDKTVAADDACRIEHAISAESFDAIKKFYNNNKA